jgi:hypothetical protein
MRAATLAALVVLGCSGSGPETTTLSEAGASGAPHQQDPTGGRSAAAESTAGERSTGGKATGGTGTGGSAEADAAGAEAGQAGGSSTGGTEATGGTQPTGGIGSGGTYPTGGGGTKATGGSSAGGTVTTGGTPTSGGRDAAGASGAAGQGTGGLVSTMPGVWDCDHELAVVCPTGCSLLGIDPYNCGECGNDLTVARWGDRVICVNGVGQNCPDTSDGHRTYRCQTSCHDLRTDKQNCGECGNDCGHGRCFDGVCE